jgi:hypothetical protein
VAEVVDDSTTLGLETFDADKFVVGFQLHAVDVPVTLKAPGAQTGVTAIVGLWLTVTVALDRQPKEFCMVTV